MNSPFYCVLLVSADKLTEADNYLYRHGYGRGNLNRALIREADPDNAPAKGWACMVQVDAAFVTTARTKAAAIGAKAQVFASMHRQTAKQEALAFVTSKGYRVKPIEGSPI